MKGISNSFCIFIQFFRLVILSILLLNYCSILLISHEVPIKNFKELDGYAKKEAAENRFSGVALVVKEGEVMFLEAYGLASKRYGVPNKVDTKFNIGSLNKLFTTVAVAQLMEKNKIALDDSINQYLPDIPPEVAEKVTIKHLLQSQAGWGDYWNNPTFVSSRPRLRTVSAYMAFIKDIPLDFEPGTNQQHCNTCYEILGAIIEKASGLDYYEYIRENVYKPSGMINSDSYERDLPVNNLAMGYTNFNPFGSPQKEGYQRNNVYLLGPKGTPAGGGYSTCEDLHQFVLALLNNKLLNPDYTNFMLNRFEGPIGNPFQPPGPLRMMGGAPGISAFLGISFQTGHTVVVLSNYDIPAADRLGEAIFKMLDITN